MELLLPLLTGTIMSIITKISNKYNVSQSKLILLMSLIGGFAYTYLQQYNPDLLEAGLQFGGIAVVWSQSIYLLFMQNKEKGTST